MSYTKGKLQAMDVCILDEQSNQLAQVTFRPPFSLDEGYANAKRIVTAWNSHDALVEALELCNEAFFLSKRSNIENVQTKAYRALTDALKLAKGE